MRTFNWWVVSTWLVACLSLLLLSGCAETLESRVLQLTTVETNQADEKVQVKIAEYQQRITQNPADAQAVGELGVAFELHGFSAEAVTAYELASTLAPEEFRWLYYRAILLAARFDLDHAIELIDTAIALRADYGPAWIQKGRMLLNHGKFEEALASFKHAERLTDDPYARMGQALAQLELNRPKATLALLDELGELGTEISAQRLRATALIRLGETERGTELLAKLPQGQEIGWQDPIAEDKWRHAVDHFNARLVQAASLIRAQNYESALLVLADLRAEIPDNKHVLHLLGSVYELRGNHQAAFEIIQEGIRLYPDFYVFRTAAANLLQARGHVQEALQQLDAAIEIDPKLHWAYVQKARMRMETKNWLEASQLLDTAIGLKNDDPDLYTYLGICLSFMDRWPEAANLYRVALSFDDKHVPSYINLARAETILANEEEALEALAQARAHGASPGLIASIERQREQIKRMQIENVGK